MDLNDYYLQLGSSTVVLLVVKGFSINSCVWAALVKPVFLAWVRLGAAMVERAGLS